MTSTFLWFAVTFWVYLETRSVVATGVIGAAFGLSSALLGPAFGTFVDRHRKHWRWSSPRPCRRCASSPPPSSFLLVDAEACSTSVVRGSGSLIGLTLLGSVTGQLRSIALSTCVTLLVAGRTA